MTKVRGKGLAKVLGNEYSYNKSITHTAKKAKFFNILNYLCIVCQEILDMIYNFLCIRFLQLRCVMV